MSTKKSDKLLMEVRFKDLNSEITYIECSEVLTRNFLTTKDEREDVVSIVIPNGVVKIDEKAFFGFKNLISVTIPASVEDIDNPFMFCAKLETIEIPSGVKKISAGTFSRCDSLTLIDVVENDNFSSLDGVLYNKDKTTLIKYPEAKSNTMFTIPEGVKTIGAMAFLKCNNLQEVITPKTLKTIEFEAFWMCENLESIVISEGVKTIEGFAFEGFNKLRSINIPDSVRKIGEFAFNSELIESINVSNNNKSFASIDGVLFNKQLTTLITYPPSKTSSQYYIPQSVSKILNGSFASCKQLKSITISKNVKTIEALAVVDDVLDSINVECDSKHFISVDGVLFNKKITTLVKYPSAKIGSEYRILPTVLKIETGSFITSNNLESLLIPSNVKTIEEHAFCFENNIQIYAEATVMPKGWKSGWNDSKIDIKWGSVL